MRNFLSDKSLIAWEDEDFVVGVYGDDRRFVPGKAAKWKAGEELMAMIEAAGMQEVGVGGGVIVEEKEEEEDILHGCNQPDQVCKQEDGEEKATLYGHKAVSQFLPTPNPRESASFLDVLDRLGIWIPLSKPRFAGYSTGQLRMAA